MNMPIKPIAMRDAFLAKIRDAMDSDPSIFFVTADFGSPVLDAIRERHPDRFVNVGIAEQNLINISAGLALEGFNVFAYAIAPFITMRCFEQIRVNLCLLSQVRPMSVTLIGVGAGYSYVVSGPTHQCYEDISIMRTLPTIRVMSPSDHVSTAQLFDKCQEPGIRYLRLDAQVLPMLNDGTMSVNENGFRVLRNGSDPITIISTGYMTHTAIEVADGLAQNGINPTIVDLVDLSASNNDALIEMMRNRKLVVSMEEGFIGCGGVDAFVQRLMLEAQLRLPYLPIGVTPKYSFELGSRKQLHEEAGIGVSICQEKIKSFLERMA